MGANLAAVLLSAVVGMDDPRVAVMGRVDARDPRRVRLGFPGVTVRLRVDGPRLAMRAVGKGNASFDVIIDGGKPAIIRLAEGEQVYRLADGLAAGPHDVDIVRRNEAWQGVATLMGFELEGKLLEPAPWPARKLLFIGDSVTAGEGTERPKRCLPNTHRYSNARVSYGMLIGQALDAQVHLVAFGGRGLVRDWTGRSDTLTAPQFFELALPDETPDAPRWNHAGYIPDAVFVSLGTNDFNLDGREPPERAHFVDAYVRFVGEIRRRYPNALVLLTEGALLHDSDHPAKRRSMLKSYIGETVARVGDPRVRHMPSNHYGGDTCDAHPTGAQHREMAKDLAPLLRDALGW